MAAVMSVSLQKIPQSRRSVQDLYFSLLRPTGGGQKIIVDGKIITVPTLSVAEFCKQYRLSDEIGELLQNEKFETAGAVLEAPEGNLEKAGFRQGQIAELKRGLREFLFQNKAPPTLRTMVPGGRKSVAISRLKKLEVQLVFDRCPFEEDIYHLKRQRSPSGIGSAGNAFMIIPFFSPPLTTIGTKIIQT